MLIDYKTGNADKLAAVCTLLEDTQLAFYAACDRRAAGAPPRATAIDDAPPREIEHLTWRRAPAAGRRLGRRPARRGKRRACAGEGEACEFCHARGLRRRDH
jgi:hypothetical protein